MAKRPAALQVQGLETYHSLRSLQAPFADTPLTGSFSTKRKHPGGEGELTKLLVCAPLLWGGMCCTADMRAFFCWLRFAAILLTMLYLLCTTNLSTCCC